MILGITPSHSWLPDDELFLLNLPYGSFFRAFATSRRFSSLGEDTGLNPSISGIIPLTSGVNLAPSFQRFTCSSVGSISSPPPFPSTKRICKGQSYLARLFISL